MLDGEEPVGQMSDTHTVVTEHSGRDLANRGQGPARNGRQSGSNFAANTEAGIRPERALPLPDITAFSSTTGWVKVPRAI